MNDSTGNRNYTMEYAGRVNKAMDYIEGNLDKTLRLDDVALEAGFSKYHFHRMFQSFVGETLFDFIQRLRLEKSAALLLSLPDMSVTEIALECGFSGSSSFAKGFKNHFGMSSSEWRKRHKDSLLNNISNVEQNSNLRQTERNLGKERPAPSMYIEYARHSQLWRVQMETSMHVVEVKELPEMTVAYVRYVGPYKGDSDLFEGLHSKLHRWAGARNLLHFPETQSLIIYHDSPEITEKDKLRISVCITIPENTEVSGEIGKLVIPAGKYALARFELDSTQFQEAWNWVYGTWLPASGYAPDDRPCFEWYLAGSDASSGKFLLDICVPVRPL